MLIIGIAGGSGSGKTTVVKKLLKVIPAKDIAVIPQDNYYRDNAHIPESDRKFINFDHPRSIEFELLGSHLQELKSGNSIEMPQYSYLTCTRSTESITIEPLPVILVEGIMVLTQADLRDLFDIKIFVDAADDDRLMRIIKRDLEERGRGVKEVLHRYVDTVKPMHRQFIEPSKIYADMIIPHGGKNEIAIDMLSAAIQNKINVTHV